MSPRTTKWQSTVRRTTATLVAGFGVLTVATAAQAHDEKYWKRNGPPFVPPGHVYYTPPVYYAPPVVYAAPRPVVVYPPPMVYEAPPAYYGPPPGLNLNFNVPLR
ncbi:hypothetical protein SAMN02745126_04389 [Enhydrobacter aerosaccus]|uniref:PXPV repeat-containing protein n=1 Tax=Enhydrobacter aerosaccus TaxID=225324 RepID=A0A1T4S7S9_9HYPH|nr:hypothetical protein [Enhydrobacter aerosaccus]SKA24295.1 hypothetical protein SAMN02745126_04389 [Enhydrobacter aerosaccus]